MQNPEIYGRSVFPDCFQLFMGFYRLDDSCNCAVHHSRCLVSGDEDKLYLSLSRPGDSMVFLSVCSRIFTNDVHHGEFASRKSKQYGEGNIPASAVHRLDIFNRLDMCDHE